VIVLLRESRHLLNEDLGVAGKASVIAYLVPLPLGGFFAHLAGPRRVLLGAGILIAIAALGMGFVFDARGYALLCLLLGLAAGLIPGAAVTAIGFWFAPQEQARAIAVLQAAPVIGALIATLLMSNRTEHWTGHRLSDY
ncbi:MFS transporter, partial [Leclercia adecarboxylata]|uniref:MFS transporter n=1 Tax=Leclercia adecarboxylata TaxID=83655 RepID=UPI00234D39E2